MSVERERPGAVPTRHLRVAVAAGLTVAVVVAAPSTRSLLRADAPPGRYDVPTPDTVFDRECRLTWQREVDPVRRTRQEAVNYCFLLRLDGGGWRVPSVKELLTIIDPRRMPAIDPFYFPNTPPETFWSSSPYAGFVGASWYVDFNFGQADNAGLDDLTRYVRCVR